MTLPRLFSVTSYTQMWIFSYFHLGLLCIVMLSNNNPSPTPASEEAVRDSTAVIIQLLLFWERKQIFHCLYCGILNKNTIKYLSHI